MILIAIECLHKIDEELDFVVEGQVCPIRVQEDEFQIIKIGDGDEDEERKDDGESENVAQSSPPGSCKEVTSPHVKSRNNTGGIIVSKSFSGGEPDRWQDNRLWEVTQRLNIWVNDS
ncbi:hypothetical protein V6N13_060365 [Hibiscus sabdariffa]|uniref:Uncharacterized protein n=1 Tax=Hibiscus sabdariffa TaxID=183260 RepID=A0ABR2GA93_9ROSI